MSGSDRYYNKRGIGISPVRSDGSLTSAFTDESAAAAEKFAAEFLGCKFNNKILKGGDGGSDFSFSLDVEVVWLGVDERDNNPRLSGYLIINQYEPHRWADIYIVVSGRSDLGFSILGWTTHNVFIKNHRMRDFGYGPKMVMQTNQLYKIETLLALKRNKS